MSRPKQPFSNFDLPRQHLGVEGHYVPPKARDATEAARRKTLAPGTVLAELQVKGIDISRNIVANVEPGRDMAFSTRLIGMAAINSSWYTFGQGAPDVMRRRLLLPKVADHAADWRKSAEELRVDAVDGLADAANMAQGVTAAVSKDRLTTRRVRQFGRYLGNVSLRVAVLGDGETAITGDAFEAQKQVRDKALDLLEFARNFSEQTGAHPSIAQLADPDSPLSVYWRREAPDGAYRAYESALER